MRATAIGPANVQLGIDEAMTTYYENCETAAKKIIGRIGRAVIIGVPLGIGKPIGLLNALYRLALTDPSMNLTIITGLTLARPVFHQELEKRFAGPILERILKGYEDPLYEQARMRQELPSNIKVIEFFLTPGEYLNNAYVQQNYISSKYTSVVADTIYYSINVYAQQVSRATAESHEYSLSCNTDLSKEIITWLKQTRKSNHEIAVVAEVNLNLPFMTGEAIINADVFTEIIDTKKYNALFPLPRNEISTRDHLIGLYASCLIKDDGCLQIGIGKLSNPVANALIMRHNNNGPYQDILRKLLVKEKFGETLITSGSISTFDKGLNASTEMLSDEFLWLYKERILKKRVYDDIHLQGLLNADKIQEKITPEIIDILLENKIITPMLTVTEVAFLKKYGILKSNIEYASGNIILASGEMIAVDLANQQSKQQIIEKCLGEYLKSGKCIHAGFFIGSLDFYQKLKGLSEKEAQEIEMTSIKRTNTLLLSYELAKLQRKNARFINSAMMVTLGGGYVSDGLKNLQEISGVGGQFDFVTMARHLPQARSIITCHSANRENKIVKSNIVWDYPNITIPRYLRDIVVTEYGIADCLSKTDSEVIKSLLNITDSRFQEALLKKAKKYGKLPNDYEIPKIYQNNYPAMVEPIINEFKRQGYFQPYPFGSDLTNEEKILQQALLFLKTHTKAKLIFLIIKSLFLSGNNKKFDKYLARMKLNSPANIQDFIYKKLLIYAILKTATRS